MHTNRLALRIFLLLVVVVVFFYIFFIFIFGFCFELDDGAKHAYVCVCALEMTLPHSPRSTCSKGAFR